jgi:hypothetical protein
MLASCARHRYLWRMSKLPDEPNDDRPITYYERFLYLLTELEQVVEQGGIQWEAESAVVSQRRLDRLSAIIRRIAAERRSH